MMVHKHLYSGMSHFDNNLLFFHNEFLPNQAHTNKEMLYFLLQYMYLQKESFYNSVKGKIHTIIPTSIWFTRSVIDFALLAIETRWTYTKIMSFACVLADTIILTRFEHVTQSIGDVAIGSNARTSRWNRRRC